MQYADELEHVEVIETGTFIDRLTGGIPRGCITEIWGDESMGKSTLAMQAVAVAQGNGLRCLWADVEWSYSAAYSKALGVDNSKLALIREELAEDMLDALIEAIGSGKYDLVVLDAVGGLKSRDEAEKQFEGKSIGTQASLIARFCRKVVPLLVIKNVALVAINHSFVDIMSSKLLTSGGKKFQYHKSLSIRLKLKNGPYKIMQGEDQIGKVIVAEVKKDKVFGNEGAEAEGKLIFKQGFSAAFDRFDDELAKGLIRKEGNTYWRGEVKLGVGRAKASEALAHTQDTHSNPLPVSATSPVPV